MRVGILAPPWLPVPPTAYGGTESVIDGLARGLAAAGHDVLLWTVGESSCPVPRGSVYDLGCTDAMGLATIEIRHVAAGYEAFARWGAQLVHDHTITGPLVAGASAPYPVVSTNHGLFDDEALARYRVTRGEIAVIAISNDQARRALDVPIAATIHHGVDPTLWPVGAGTGDGDGEYVAFLGRMAPEKGAHLAAEVARRVGARLLLGAKMRERSELEYFATEVEPRLGRDAIYLGELDRRGKVELLRHARALINPIRWAEPFGLAMIESLACGTPVVSFRVGSSSEIIEHGRTGFLCSDVDEMVHALGKLDRIDRRACRQSVLTRFSFERMVSDHISLYEAILREEPRPSGARSGEAA